ncbi:MAG: hypothetical protein ACE363_10400 [Alphaproteobacteria bacterium]
MTIALWKKLLVVTPAFLIVHLTASGIPQLIDGFREFWELTPGQDTRIALAFPAGYAAAIPLALLLPVRGLRAGLTLAILVCLLASAVMAFYVNGYGFAMPILLSLGAAAGFSVPISGRLLGLSRVPPLAIAMSVLVVVGWYASIPFFEFFKQGLPIGDAAGWAGPYIVQAVLALVWLPLALFSIPSRPPGRFRQ